jgi:hypothetical protein
MFTLCLVACALAPTCYSQYIIYPEAPKLHVGRYSDPPPAGRSGDRIPVKTRFSVPVQTGPGPTSLLYNGYRVSFPGVKRPVSGVTTYPHLAKRLKKEYSVPILPAEPSWPVLGRNLSTLLLANYSMAISTCCEGLPVLFRGRRLEYPRTDTL